MLRFIQSAGTAFFAGALSLVSQIIGLRLATRELSASETTIATVLLSALAGLSIGAFLFGRIADRLQRPERLANLLLASASLVVLLVALFGREFASAIRILELREFLEATCFAAISILPANVLLGGIVPVLTKTNRRGSNVQTAFGWIYALETVGAATGSLAITFIAIPFYGVRLSLLVTAGIILVWNITSLLPRAPAETEHDSGSKAADADIQTSIEPEATGRSSLLRWMFVVAALASSCASLGMELVWQRYFAIVFGSDSHSYAIVATVFLAGVSLGSAVSARWLRFQIANSKLYAWLLLAIGGSILLSVWILGFGFRADTFRSALSWLDQSPMGGRLLLAACVLFLPSVAIGAALPVLVRLWVAGRDSVGTRAGEIYALVIAGNIIGVLFSASVFIPAFGLQTTSIILGCVCTLVSLGIFLIPNSDRRSETPTEMRTFPPAAFAILFLGVTAIAVVVARSPFRPGLSESDESVVEHYAEEASHTVAVLHASDDPTLKRLLIDGVTIGESGGGVDEKQQMLAHLPFMPGNVVRKNVLTIGLGTGILAGELTVHDQVRSLTCVELSAAVIEAATRFESENRNVLQNDKLRLVHGDGVRFLRSSETKFDVIVSDGKSRPGAASNLPFFSREFYQLCSQALSDDGIFVQWVSLRCDQKELETILSTFCGSFPFGHVAISAPDSVYLVGTQSPLQFDPDAIRSQMEMESTDRLNAYGWRSADDIYALYWLDQTVVAKTLQTVAPNTFDHPVLEIFAWDSFRHSVTIDQPQLELIQKLIELDEDNFLNGQPLAATGEPQDASLTPESIRRIVSGRLAAKELLAGEAIRNRREANWLDRATVHFRSAMEHLPALNRQQHIAGDFRKLVSDARSRNDVNTEFSALLNLAELKFAVPDDEARMARILLNNRAINPAMQHFFQAVKLSDGHPTYRLLFAEGLLESGNAAQALSQVERALRTIADPPDREFLAPLQPRAKLLKGIALMQMRRPDQGAPLIEEALADDPELQELYRRFFPQQNDIPNS